MICKSAAARRFARRCRISISVSLVLFLGCSQLASRYPNGMLSPILAGLAGAFFFAELVSSGLLLLRMRDEFQRILLTRSFLWATVITMGFATVWGFVEVHGHGMVPEVPILSVPAVLIFVTAAAKLLIFRKYRSPSE